MNYLLAVIDKLDEASFFCRLTRNDPDNIHYYVNAFAGAAFAIWECLARLTQPTATGSEKCQKCGNVKTVFPDNDEAWNWLKTTKREITKSPIGAYFHDGRSADVHAGVGFVNGWSGKVWLDENGEFQTTSSGILRDGKTAEFPAGTAPSDASEAYLAKLVQIVAEGYERFGAKWDAGRDLERDVRRLQQDLSRKPEQRIRKKLPRTGRGRSWSQGLGTAAWIRGAGDLESRLDSTGGFLYCTRDSRPRSTVKVAGVAIDLR